MTEPLTMNGDRSASLSALQVLRPAAGGMLRHVAAVVRGMEERDIRCAVAGPAGLLPTYPDGLTVSVDVPIRSTVHPIFDPKAAIRVAKAARSYDLIHAHGLRAAWIAGWAARLARTPMVMTAHNVPEVHGFMRIWALKRSAASARAVVAVSHAVSAALVEIGVPPDRIVVIPNGVRLRELPAAAHRADHGFGPDAFVVIGAGRMSHEKGFDVLIRALGLLSSAYPQARLVLCGTGPEQQALAAEADVAGLADRVRLTGYVNDLDAWLLAADAVAVPSRTEGQGLVALEAMALGKPVVAANVGGLPELIEDGVSGLLVPPDNPEALATAILRLANDRDLRHRLGTAAQQRVRDRFSLDAMLDRLAQLYAAVAYPR